MYHHKKIKRFQVSGTILDDSALARFKTEYIRILDQSMRDRGYVQRIDITPDFTISYNDGSYEFDLSVYGVYVGRKQAECIEYLDGHMPHMKPTKLPAFLVPQESQ